LDPYVPYFLENTGTTPNPRGRGGYQTISSGGEKMKKGRKGEGKGN
jgi:hypothetical protein